MALNNGTREKKTQQNGVEYTEQDPRIFHGLSLDEFRSHAHDVLDVIVRYKQNVHLQNVTPDVQHGFLEALLPAEPPHHPESWSEIMHDVEHVFMKGVANLRHPQFHGYIPVCNSNAANLGAMLQEGIGNITAKWISGPAGIELEILVMDWMVRSLGLPDHFLHGARTGGKGGGTLANSSSETTFLSMVTARNKKIEEEMVKDSSLTKHSVLAKLVAYSSEESHFAVDRATNFTMVQHHRVKVTPEDDYAMRGRALKQAMAEDREKGLIPFFILAALGTTSTCSFDNLAEIGPLAKLSGCWLHVDAAYAGPAFLCPEYQHYLQGVEHVDSIAINFYKWMLMGIGCSGFWVKDASCLVRMISGSAEFIIDRRDHHMWDMGEWQLQSAKGNHALQAWFVIRIYGISGLQQHIRNHVALAKLVGSLLKADARFQLMRVHMGLVCFKLKGQPNAVNRQFVEAIKADGRTFFGGAATDAEGYFMRLVMFDEMTSKKDVEKTVQIVQEVADKFLNEGPVRNGSKIGI